MKQFIAALLFIAIFSNAVFAQRTKPGAAVKFPEKTEKVKIDDPPNDFYDTGLPEAAIIGENASDKLAASLAVRISRYEDKSLSLLMATLQKAGFYIIDENQKILYKPTNGQGMGLAFYDFEVVGMLKLSRRGIVTSLGKMNGLIGKELKKPAPDELSGLMLGDLKNAYNSKDQTKRFWAHLIVEMSRNLPQPVDLLNASPETAQINIIQASLWERRLVGDLIAFAANQPSAVNFNQRKLFKPAVKNFSFTNAAFVRSFAPDPCDYTQVETVQVDVAATALTTIHGTTLEAVAEYGKLEGLGKIGAGIGIVNLVLSWAKLIAAVSQMKGEIRVEEPLPLIRTKSSNTPGEKRLLTGKFEIKVNDLRKLNCFRLAANMATGLDFSMPSSGPLTEKPVSWELIGELSFGGQKSSQTGSFEQVVYLLPVEGANRDHHKQETDANGESKIYLEGGKQKRDLNGEKVVPLPKKAKVRADVALKNMKDSKQEMADVGGFALGTLIGGVTPVGILSALPEIGNRVKIPVTAISIPVRDWTPCSEDWGGTINYKREFSQTIVVKANRQSNGNSTGDGVRRISQIDEADVTLNPRKPEDMATTEPLPASIFARGKRSDIFTGIREGDPCCGKQEGSFNTKFREGFEENYSDVVKRKANVSFRGTERDYNLSFDFYTDAIKSSRNEFLEVDSTCQIERDEAYSRTEDGIIALQGSLPSGRYGQRVVNSEGELLFGEKTVGSPDGATITWTWALARCRN